MASPPQYRHPGQNFIARHGLLQHDEDVLRYVEFLRQEAGLSDEPPVNLAKVYHHFGMPEPLRVPLVDQQGILLDSDAGLILIKEDDPIVRQRFTEGHELMELLFDAQEKISGADKLPWDEQKKEKLCDQGAAELLMPRSSFAPKLQELGMSLKTGSTLASLYQTSLIATLVRMIQHPLEPVALIMWHCALSRKEATGQNQTEPPQKKLRIWWRTRTTAWTHGFIPKNKSVPHDSLISLTYTTGQPRTGTEVLDLGWGAIQCRIESMPMQIGDKSCVLSLLHLLERRGEAFGK